MQFLTENWGAIVAALLAISEVLALIPSLKSNSIFTLVVNVLKSLTKPKELPPGL